MKTICAFRYLAINIRETDIQQQISDLLQRTISGSNILYRTSLTCCRGQCQEARSSRWGRRGSSPPRTPQGSTSACSRSTSFGGGLFMEIYFLVVVNELYRVLIIVSLKLSTLYLRNRFQQCNAHFLVPWDFFFFLFLFFFLYTQTVIKQTMLKRFWEF